MNRDCFATISPSLADLYRRHVTGLTTSPPRPALPVYQRLHASAHPVANCSHNRAQPRPERFVNAAPREVEAVDLEFPARSGLQAELETAGFRLPHGLIHFKILLSPPSDTGSSTAFVARIDGFSEERQGFTRFDALRSSLQPIA